MTEFQTQPAQEITLPTHELLSVPIILEKTVDANRLSESSRPLGSFSVEVIPDGSILPMNEKVGLLADFENINTLERSTPSNFNAFKDKIAQDPTYEKFRDWQSKMSGSEGELAAALYFTTGLAKEYFGKTNATKEERDGT